MWSDGRELGIDPFGGRRIVGGGDGADRDAHTLPGFADAGVGLREKEGGDEREGHCWRSSDIQITVVWSGRSMTAPSCVPNSTSSICVRASARSAPSSAGSRGGANQTASARQAATASPPAVVKSDRCAPHSSLPRALNGVRLL